MKTLELRVERHNRNAMEIAKRLSEHKKVGGLQGSLLSLTASRVGSRIRQRRLMPQRHVVPGNQCCYPAAALKMNHIP
jgi:hypothetical protein